MSFQIEEENQLKKISPTLRSVAADTDIVAFGVSKDINAQTIINYAEKQDTHAVNCELLTI